MHDGSQITRGFIIHGGAHAFPLSPSAAPYPVSLLADPGRFRAALLECAIALEVSFRSRRGLLNGVQEVES